ncbi:hypothetical protein JHK86_014679 [Glycine max]|nr:hypothetical protein JHK86_014679 [Glycine max]
MKLVGNLSITRFNWQLNLELKVAGCMAQLGAHCVATKPPGYAFIDFGDRRDPQDAIHIVCSPHFRAVERNSSRSIHPTGLFTAATSLNRNATYTNELPPYRRDLAQLIKHDPGGPIGVVKAGDVECNGGDKLEVGPTRGWVEVAKAHVGVDGEVRWALMVKGKAVWETRLQAAMIHTSDPIFSYGQSLTTSTFVWETAFAILIAILGLVLFAHLIGNMQTYLQSITVRLEEWRLKRRDTEEWMSHRQLPQNLRERVRRFVQYKWLATRGVDEETILRGLPTDLRRDIQRHLCLDLVRRVPFFSQMDDQLLDAICERLVSSLSTQGTNIVREGDPVTEMLFIIRGRLESSTTNGGRTGFFNSIALRPGDFCGEELLAWALLPKSTLNLPSSTRTVKALVEVEAFALRAEDLKFVANQFRRLHSKKLQHTFRFYSHHWRTWAACFIQAAWRRFKKRMLAKSLSLRECQSFNHDEQVGDEMEHGEEEHSAVTSNTAQVKQNLGVTIIASRFAANTRKGVQKIKDVELPKFQKPEEPDFSVEPDDD